MDAQASSIPAALFERLPKLAEAFARSVEDAARGTSAPTLLLSGGIDSALVGWVLRSHSTDATALVVGVRDAPDHRSAAEAASLLHLPLADVQIGASDIDGALREVEHEIRSLQGPLRSVAVAETVALMHAPGERVFCGQGADELFLGYAHFRGLDAGAASLRRRSDWSLLVDSEWPRLNRIASRMGKSVTSPYLDSTFSRQVLAIPVEYHLPGPVVKPVLRELARFMELPEALVNRPKRAWQYGSGVDKLLRRRGPSGPSTRLF